VTHGPDGAASLVASLEVEAAPPSDEGGALVEELHAAATRTNAVAAAGPAVRIESRRMHAEQHVRSSATTALGSRDTTCDGASVALQRQAPSRRSAHSSAALCRRGGQLSLPDASRTLISYCTVCPFSDPAKRSESMAFALADGDGAHRT
jgi:hypothetical protein